MTKKYSMKVDLIEAIQYNGNNFHEVIAFCTYFSSLTGHKISLASYDESTGFIINFGTKVASVHIGEWVTKRNTNFRIWTDEKFRENFQEVVNEF